MCTWCTQLAPTPFTSPSQLTNIVEEEERHSCRTSQDKEQEPEGGKNKDVTEQDQNRDKTEVNEEEKEEVQAPNEDGEEGATTKRKVSRT